MTITMMTYLSCSPHDLLLKVRGEKDGGGIVRLYTILRLRPHGDALRGRGINAAAAAETTITAAQVVEVLTRQDHMVSWKQSMKR